MSRAQVREQFSMVLQDSWVFDGTVADNISYGKEGATMEDVVRAAETVGCDTFIHVMPDGYDTYISEENSQLSVGEKQLLVLARAVLADPKILILDDSVSAVDTKTEQEILTNLKKNRAGLTTILIAHRISTVEDMDKIVFIDDGRVVDVGTHDELVLRCPDYKKMVDLQKLEDEGRQHNA